MADSVVNTIANRLSLRSPQRISLEILARICDIISLEKGADVAQALRAVQSEFSTVTDFERDFAIVCDLLRLGLAKEEIWELVSGSSKFESAGRPYFDLTITNAERTVTLDGATASGSRVST